MFGTEINFKTMAHIEDFIHLSPISRTFLLNKSEKWWEREQIVFDHMLAIHEMHHLCLCAAGAVNHTMDFRAHFLKERLDNRGIRARGRQYEFTGRQLASFNLIEKFASAAVNEVCLLYTSDAADE